MRAILDTPTPGTRGHHARTDTRQYRSARRRGAVTEALRVGSMCTGYGGLDLAITSVYNAELAWCADNDPHAAKIIGTRFPGVPNLGDLTTIDWSDVPPVDVVTAGFPCQDISYAGAGAGIRKDTRSGLWYTIAQALRLLRPPLVLLENVAALRTRGLAQVLGDLAALRYDTAWTCLRASDIGAPHRRDRLFLLAHTPGTRFPRRPITGPAPSGGPSGQPSRYRLLQAPADPVGVQCQRRRNHQLLDGTAGPATTTPGDAAQHRRPPAAAHPHGQLCHQRQPEPVRLPRQSHPARSGSPHHVANLDWGPYDGAIRTWQTILGRPAPPPTEPGRRGQPRLSARFVEWLMGLPDGWVTAIDLPRVARMRALGNGVVPQQATAALSILCDLLGADPGCVRRT